MACGSCGGPSSCNASEPVGAADRPASMAACDSAIGAPAGSACLAETDCAAGRPADGASTEAVCAA
eukprot:6380662-Alexandrium_andersonii.AAC.1